MSEAGTEQQLYATRQDERLLPGMSGRVQFTDAESD